MRIVTDFRGGILPRRRGHRGARRRPAQGSPRSTAGVSQIGIAGRVAHRRLRARVRRRLDHVDDELARAGTKGGELGGKAARGLVAAPDDDHDREAAVERGGEPPAPS